MKCTDCGHTIPDGMLFCTRCGAVADIPTGNADGNESPSRETTVFTDAIPANNKVDDDTGLTQCVPPENSYKRTESTGTDEQTYLQAALDSKYEILGLLGTGGMATVYLAREKALDRRVALKVLPPALTHDNDFVTRFRHEAQIAASLEHPNIVRVFSISDDAAPCYFTMSHIPGGSITDRIAAQGSLDTDDIVRWGGGICSALSYGHERGVIHRDLKPDNIMIGQNGEAVLTDYGIARAAASALLTRAGSVVGTPRYMSPEQAKGRQLDARSDIYAMGVVLYHMATGTLPFEADDPASLMFRHVNEPPQEPQDRTSDIPPWLNNVILKCMAKRADDRYQTAADLGRALIEHHKPIIDKTSLMRTRPSQGLLRYMIPSLAVIALAAAFFIWRFFPPPGIEAPANASDPAGQESPQNKPEPAISQDDLSWQQAMMVDTAQAYNTYIHLYPDGAHIGEARKRIGELTTMGAAEKKTPEPSGQPVQPEQATVADRPPKATQNTMEDSTGLDDAAFEQARITDSIDSYTTYLSLYPAGRHIDQAQQTVAELQAEQARFQREREEQETRLDDEAFTVATDADTPEAYSSYLISWPEGRHRNEARSRIDEIKAAKEFHDKVRLGLSRYSISLAEIPAGVFIMGSPDGDKDEMPAHTVSIGAFRMSDREITQSQYREVMGDNPSFFRGLDNNPVERVSWYNAIAFCNTLSAKLNLEPCYNLTTGECDMARTGFRLPTEAEWEYACRASSGSKYHNGDGEAALSRAGWFAGNSGERTHMVGKKDANAWGLHDMHGNVWEWCNDWFAGNHYGRSASDDPSGPAGGEKKVIRGGSWIENASGCRASRRRSHKPGKDYSDIGFRIVRR